MYLLHIPISPPQPRVFRGENAPQNAGFFTWETRHKTRGISVKNRVRTIFYSGLNPPKNPAHPAQPGCRPRGTRAAAVHSWIFNPAQPCTTLHNPCTRPPRHGSHDPQSSTEGPRSSATGRSTFDRVTIALRPRPLVTGLPLRHPRQSSSNSDR